ncbi:MAG: TraM recognition domain-containing protein, partial [Galactobacter sp.]
MNPQERSNGRVIMFLIIVLLILGVVMTLGGNLASLIRCQTMLHSSGLGAALSFLTGKDPKTAFGTNTDGCVPESAWVWGGFITVAVVLTLLACLIWMWWSNYKQSDKYLVKDLRSREGFAQYKEVKAATGEANLVKKAATYRPSLRGKSSVTGKDVGLCLGKAWGTSVWTTVEDSLILIGPPRSGKGFYIVINAILDAPGAVITTSTRADNYAATKDLRAKDGRPVMLFDPQGMSKTSTAMKWSLSQGCENPMTAARRAEILIKASGSGKSSNNQEWTEQSQMILMQLLHAAALGNKGGLELGRWAQNPVMAQEAADILANHPDAEPSYGPALKATLGDDPRTLGAKWMGVSGALGGLRIPEIAESLSPRTAADLMDPRTFIRDRGTLYLIGTSSGGSSTAPFVMALLDEMTYAARQMAITSPGNRLDPPMSLILDEIANIAPWPELPTVMADGGGVGISTMVVVQSLAQARAQWGEEEAQAIFDSAIVKIQLGGAGNDKD